MEQLYSVGTTNRYAMLVDDEDDPGDVITPTSNKQEKDVTLTKTTGKGGKDTSKQTKNGVKGGKETKEKTAQKQNKVILENVNKSKLISYTWLYYSNNIAALVCLSCVAGLVEGTVCKLVV